jgi:nicotinamidase-related amidase
MFGVHNIAAAHDNECFERWHELTCRNYSITEYTAGDGSVSWAHSSAPLWRVNGKRRLFVVFRLWGGGCSRIGGNPEGSPRSFHALSGLLWKCRMREVSVPSAAAISSWFTDFASPQRRKAMVETFGKDCHGFALWPGLDVRSEDLIVDKTRFGAFVPGSSQLHETLQARGIDTLIITGTATNVCCESTARDAMQMNYKVIFLADGNAALSDAEHNATLNNMVALLADVMTTEEVVCALDKAAAMRQAAE